MSSTSVLLLEAGARCVLQCLFITVLRSLHAMGLSTAVGCAGAQQKAVSASDSTKRLIAGRGEVCLQPLACITNKHAAAMQHALLAPMCRSLSIRAALNASILHWWPAQHSRRLATSLYAQFGGVANDRCGRPAADGADRGRDAAAG